MGQKITSKLNACDWNEEWKELQKSRRRADDSAYWDKRAKTFTTKDYPGSYTDTFLNRAAILPGESVLDMGCGTGALSIPLAEQGHPVLACDFSQGMLDRMNEEISRLGIQGITSKILSWSDDWAAHGIPEKSVDVAIASRSIAADDMREALLKLNSAAKRRVHITLTTGSSPRINERILTELGLQAVLGRDHLYAFNILTHEGFFPEVSYISSKRKDTFDSHDEAFEYYREMIEYAGVTQEEVRDCALEKLKPLLKNSLIPNEDAGKLDRRGRAEKVLRLNLEHQVTWAFISWDVVVA